MCCSSSPYCLPSSSLSSCSSCSCSSSLSLAHGSCVFGRGDSAGMREDARPAVLATWHIQLIRERMCQVASTGVPVAWATASFQHIHLWGRGTEYVHDRKHSHSHDLSCMASLYDQPSRSGGSISCWLSRVAICER